MAEEATIKVSRQARDHLARVAEERGVTLRQLVEQLAAQQRTAAQIAKQVATDRKVAREVIGVDISDEEFEKTPDVLVNLYRLAAESISTATWRKSRYSDGGDNNCLEVADNCPGVVPVRDSKRSDSAMLVFRSGSWASFVTHVKKQLSGPPASLAVSCFHGLPPGHAGGQAALLAVFGPLLR